MNLYLIIATILLSCISGISEAQKCGKVDDNHRFDCYPEEGASQQKCEARGCCWATGKSPVANRSVSDGIPARTPNTKLDVPYCYYPLDFPSYVNGAPKQTEFGFTANLTRSTKSYYPNDVMNLQFDAYFEADNRLRIKIFDPSHARYEVPIETPPFTKLASNPMYKVELGATSGFVVTRASDNEVIFNTTINPGFIYADQFLQISSSLSSSYIYGLGEHRTSLALPTDWNSYTFWARDQPPTPNLNLYGAHPFYLNMESSGKAHGVFLLNSNAMDAILQPAPAITYRTIGGILDLYILLGPDPIDVVRQYQEVVGRPFMPPLWGLGFHLCRWGYGTVNGTMAVVDRMRKAGIPQDVQWNDIDYMDSHRDWTLDPAKFQTMSDMVSNLHSNGQHYVFIIDVQWNDIEYSEGRKDFTLNTTTFGGLPEFIVNIHAHGQHYIPIIDPAISSSETPGTYPPYDTGVSDNIFTKTEDGQIFIGQVWPGDTAFPDWFHSNVSKWWQSLAQKFHDQVPYDGMWLDMNEPSNFISGTKSGCSKTSTYDNPPYVPNVVGGSLYAKTVCPSAVQSVGSHYNVHNLYGWSEVKVSHSVLINIRQKRPFIISRSSFPSSGRYGGHWLGDNFSLWPDMHYSITGILNFNMFGIPLVGADICGFNGNTNEELCTRWMQLGSFYPFSRNHNSLNQKDQDPAVFSEASRNSSRASLLIRYSLLPYIYTLFQRAHVNGSMVARPLFFNFPGDESLYKVDTQFMLGGAVLVSPVLAQGATTVDATFPAGRWYDHYGAAPFSFSASTNKTLDAPLDKINVHYRGGHVIPTLIPATTTTEMRKNPFNLLIALDQTGSAKGNLYWDDGDTIGSFENGEYIAVNFKAASNVMKSTILHDGYSGSSEMTLSGGAVHGVDSSPSSVTLNGQSCQFTYKQTYQRLSFTCSSVPFNKPVTLKWA